VEPDPEDAAALDTTLVAAGTSPITGSDPLRSAIARRLRWQRGRFNDPPEGSGLVPTGTGDVRYERSSNGTQCWSRGPTYSEPGRITRLSAYCSRTCAVHPAMRARAKIGVIRSVGMPSTWYTVAA
jgi:hypothetical protein